MIHKYSYRKRRFYKKAKNMTRYRKKYHSGGSGAIIDSFIKKIDDEYNTLPELEDYANIMTVQQTYDILNKTVDLAELLQSADYKTLLQTLSNTVKSQFAEYPNILQNIEILINDLLPKSGIEYLNSQYSTFPISKINSKLGKTYMYLPTKNIKIYDGHQYKLIAKGGFGSVYVNTAKKQAIKKVINPMPETIKDEDIFKSEVINYNNISSLVCNKNYFCRFKNCFIDDYTTLYILMEYCGKNVITTIEDLTKSQELSFETLIQWFITIAKGIQCMHDNNYVHLDIKPLNITIHNNEAKLIDFGLAYYIPDIEEKITVGTFNFMAPEMMNNKKDIDYKMCDIYSLGVTFANCILIQYFSLFKKKDDNEDEYEEVLSEDEIIAGNNDNKYEINDEYKYKLLSFIGLESMISNEPINRLTILEVITQLNSVSIHTFLHNIHKIDKLSVEKLLKAEFNLIDIFKAGYTYGEIQSIYKSNPKRYKDLGELLKHCDKNWNYLKRHISKECTIDTICLSNQLLNNCSAYPISANIQRLRNNSRRKSNSRSRSISRSSKSTGFAVDV